MRYMRAGGRRRRRLRIRGGWTTSIIDRTDSRTGGWTEDEDIKLKEAVQARGGKEWAAIATLVPGRAKLQCHKRWYDGLSPSIIDRANSRTGRWTEDEDIKLKEAVQAHGGKNWAAIATLVPGRTKIQCHKRWYDGASPSVIDWANSRTGTWSCLLYTSPSPRDRQKSRMPAAP